MRNKYIPLLTAAIMVSAAGCGNIEQEPRNTAAATSEPVTTTQTTQTTPSPTTTAEEQTTTLTETQTTTSATTETTAETSSAPEEVEGFSDEQLKIMASGYYGSRTNRLPEFIEIEKSSGSEVTIHLYDIFDGHATTSEWYYISRKTGKGTDFEGNSVDLNTPPAEMWQPDIPERQEMRENNAFCGVTYICHGDPNYMNYSQANVRFAEIFVQTGIINKYPFLGSLPESNYAETELGEELYLIIPRDPEAHVIVTEYDLKTEREIGRIYSSYDGSPFMLKCNYSDLISDIRIKITDNEGEHEVFSPYLSVSDGKPRTDCDGVMFFDFEHELY